MSREDRMTLSIIPEESDRNSNLPPIEVFNHNDEKEKPIQTQ